MFWCFAEYQTPPHARATLAPRPPHARAHSPAGERMSRRARGPREDGVTRLRPRDHPPRPQMCIISDACSSGPGPLTSKVGEPARRHSSSRTGARRPVSLRCPRASPQSSGRVWARGPEPRSFSRLDDWGRLFQVQVLKIRVPDVGFKPFAPQGEAPVLCSRMTVGGGHRWSSS